MKAWSIFTHSIGMVLRNFQQAVQIGLVPVLIGFLLVVAAITFTGVSLDMMADEATMEKVLTDNPGALGLGFFLIWLMFVVIMLWIVVSWHRFVLLEEYPQGWVPPLRLDRILSYIGHGLLLGLVMLAGVLPLAIAMFIVGAIAPPLSVIVVVLGGIALMIAMYRLIPILPAAAIGKPMKLSEAWAATDGANGTIVVLGIIMILFQIAVQFAAALVIMVPVIGPIVVYAASLVLSLVNVSILTTFYGHYVEGRPI